jgi:hypothetical protein
VNPIPPSVNSVNSVEKTPLPHSPFTIHYSLFTIRVFRGKNSPLLSVVRPKMSLTDNKCRPETMIFGCNRVFGSGECGCMAIRIAAWEDLKRRVFTVVDRSKDVLSHLGSVLSKEEVMKNLVQYFCRKRKRLFLRTRWIIVLIAFLAGAAPRSPAQSSSDCWTLIPVNGVAQWCVCDSGSCPGSEVSIATYYVCSSTGTGSGSRDCIPSYSFVGYQVGCVREYDVVTQAACSALAGQCGWWCFWALLPPYPSPYEVLCVGCTVAIGASCQPCNYTSCVRGSSPSGIYKTIYSAGGSGCDLGLLQP